VKKGVANTVIACVAFMALLVGLSVNRILNPAAMSREQLNENGLFVYEVPRRFSNFALTKHTGEPFTAADFQDKWTLLFFGFTHCPDVCPTTMASLSQFSKLLEDSEFGEDTQVIMVSVDPDRDTLEDLATYVHYFNENYLGATGEYINIFTLARQLNIAFGYLPGEEEGEYDVTHSGEIPLINPNGHFQGFFKYPINPEKMVMTYSSVRENF
jgi:protein SCO1/2